MIFLEIKLSPCNKNFSLSFYLYFTCKEFLSFVCTTIYDILHIFLTLQNLLLLQPSKYIRFLNLFRFFLNLLLSYMTFSKEVKLLDIDQYNIHSLEE